MKLKRFVWGLVALAALSSAAQAQATRPPSQRTGPITITGPGSTGDGSLFTVTPSLTAPNNSLAKTLAAPQFPSLKTPSGNQSILVQSTGEPPGGSQSSQYFFVDKPVSGKFDVMSRFDCASSKGAEYAQTVQNYLGVIVCMSSTGVSKPGSGGMYAQTLVVEEQPGVAAGTPLVGLELDVNKRGPHCGDLDGYVAGGLYINPCDAFFISGGGAPTRRLRSVITVDFAGGDSTDENSHGLGANRGLLFMNGRIRKATIEDITTSAIFALIEGRKTDAAIDAHNAVIDTQEFALLGSPHTISWLSGNNVTHLPLIAKDTSDRLVLGNGFVSRIRPLADVNLFVQPTNSGNGVTLASANDAGSVGQPLNVTGSEVDITTTAGFFVNIDGVKRQVIVGPTNSCGANFRCLFTPN